IKTRKLWIRRRVEAVAFSEVRAIRYRVRRVATSATYVPRGAKVTDTVESFSVHLALRRRDDPVYLISFIGEGAAATGLGGAILGDSFLDWHGTQEIESHAYVSRLQRLLEVPIRSALEDKAHAAIAQDLMPCPKCGRKIRSMAPRCVYCGSRARS
ncbi:MAG TPA: hypothetical protein VNS57_06910, partial [Steroidobacteraceae bacterium]|nr:hypothetical protein [Steroidobacteraceae bacterium]